MYFVGFWSWNYAILNSIRLGSVELLAPLSWKYANSSTCVLELCNNKYLRPRILLLLTAMSWNSVICDIYVMQYANFLYIAAAFKSYVTEHQSLFCSIYLEPANMTNREKHSGKGIAIAFATALLFNFSAKSVARKVVQKF